MKKNVFIIGFMLGIISIAKTQIYTPGGTIQGSSGNNYIGIGVIPSADNSLQINRAVSGTYSRGVYANITPMNNAPIGFHARVYNSTPLTSYRTYGIVAEVGNATSGWNFGVMGKLMGSNYGAAIIGLVPGKSEVSVGGMWAGYFRGNVYTEDYLGLGTTSPEAKLHIMGDIPQIRFTESDQTNKKWHIEAFNSGFAITETDFDTRLYIQKGGNVGIGTFDTKGYKLAVAGTMIAEKVVVKLQANWPDYVFNTDYRLKSLEEIECFIKAYKHLEGVPSSSEITENGIDVAEMNTVLLRKVEELTLLMIEQNKIIKELQAEINQKN